jgi:hypothetical protein
MKVRYSKILLAKDIRTSRVHKEMHRFGHHEEAMRPKDRGDCVMNRRERVQKAANVSRAQK